MPAPTKYPDWATDGANTVEPPAGKVATGWVPGEQPPAGWFNWWKHYTGLWVRWLESVTNTLSGRIDTNDTDINTLQSDLDALEAATATLAGDAARKSDQNTFVKSQIVNTEADYADDPLLSTTAKPGDDPTDLSALVPPVAAGSNRWKLVFKVPTQAGAWASLWVGQSPYGAALVNNARWHVPTQKWRQIDPAYVSTAMVGRSGQYVISHVPAGAAAWVDWPIDTGGDFIAGGNVQANGAGGSGMVIAKNAFQYSPTQPHWISLFPENGYNNSLTLMTLAPGAAAWYRVRLPKGAVIGQVNVKVQENAGVNYAIELGHTVTKPFSDATIPGALTTIDDSEVVSGGGTGVQNWNLNYPALTVDNEFATYWLHVLCVAGSPANLDVWGAQIGFEDPGPRNH